MPLNRTVLSIEEILQELPKETCYALHILPNRERILLTWPKTCEGRAHFVLRAFHEQRTGISVYRVLASCKQDIVTLGEFSVPINQMKRTGIGFLIMEQFLTIALERKRIKIIGMNMWGREENPLRHINFYRQFGFSIHQQTIIKNLQ